MARCCALAGRKLFIFDNMKKKYEIDCSQSPIFRQDRRNRALWLTGGHLGRVSKLLMGQGKVWDEARKIGDCSNVTARAARVQGVL